MTTQSEVEEIVKGLRTDHEPDWFSCDLKSHATIPPEDIKPSTPSGDGLPPIQQDDTFKPFLFDISNYGLNYAYHKYYKCGKDAPPECSDKYKYTKTEHPRNVIIIGAGMSGLVAGYELAQVGHNVKILEMQHRVGGRVKTISDEKFYKGLWSDGKYFHISFISIIHNIMFSCICFHVQLGQCVYLEQVNEAGLDQVTS